MPTLDFLQITGSGLPIDLQLSVTSISGDGAVIVTPRLDLLKVAGEGDLKFEIDPFNDIGDQEPFSTVSLTAVVKDVVPLSYTWRVISGPSVNLSPSGATVSFITPATTGGVVLLLGVVAHISGRDSTEQTVAVSVLPTTIKARVVNSDDSWVAAGLQGRET